MRCRGCGQTCESYAIRNQSEWWQCLFCGSQTQNAGYNKSQYNEAFLQHNIDSCGGSLEALTESMRHNISLWHRFPVPSKTILDVGCNEGCFLVEMERLGWEAHGFDVNPAAKTILSGGRFSGRVHIGDDLWHLPAGRRFGAIHVREVIEHVHDPENLLRACSTFLDTGGLVQIQTPRPTPDDPLTLYTPHHLVLLSPLMLKTMLVQNGFQIEYTEYWETGQVVIARKV
jgi:2-polyprenyl-3-methyl-5-hydroxy-6-metoxy-1,4-benzoquinol methylase